MERGDSINILRMRAPDEIVELLALKIDQLLPSNEWERQISKFVTGDNGQIFHLIKRLGSNGAWEYVVNRMNKGNGDAGIEMKSNLKLVIRCGDGVNRGMAGYDEDSLDGVSNVHVLKVIEQLGGLDEDMPRNQYRHGFVEKVK